MKKLKTITQPKLLLGEGKEEEIFFSELIKIMNINDIEIISYGGKTNLSNYLKALKLIPGFSNLISLGITRDADENKDSAYQSVYDALKRYKLPTSDNSENENNLISKIFILPDNQNKVMLEDLCFKSVADDNGISCVNSYFQCIQNNTQRQPKNMAKAKIHVWLASQIEPDKRLADAALAGYWNWNSEAFTPLKNFISSL